MIQDECHVSKFQQLVTSLGAKTDRDSHAIKTEVIKQQNINFFTGLLCYRKSLPMMEVHNNDKHEYYEHVLRLGCF